MREILFKAKRLDNEEWIEDSLLQTTAVSLKSFIVPSACYTSGRWDWAECVKVDTETICQYTGLMDKNGNRIWENDIVNKIDVNALGWHRERKGKISFNNLGYWLLTTEFGDGYWLGEFNSEQIEVIGNVFDNSELMERSE